MTHEGTQLSMVAGVVSESVDYVFLDRPWLQPADAHGTMLCSKGLVEDATPLSQMLWKHEALNLAFVASEDSLEARCQVSPTVDGGHSACPPLFGSTCPRRSVGCFCAK